MSGLISGGAAGRNLRILIVSHSHPRISRGGAEIAAFRLFAELDGCPGIESWFLGCNTKPSAGRDGIAISQPFTDREYIYSANGQFDWFNFANHDPRLTGEVEELLDELQPDIVHLHHYVNFGVEILLTIRRRLPNARILVTLHEYLAICNHFGQMVKREHFNLCNRADNESCHECFPQVEKADFFIREKYIKMFFDCVDQFVSPSFFLAGRYADWGIAKDRITVIENITAPANPLPGSIPGPVDESLQPLRIGFFGQISKLKGIGVLFECAAIVARNTDARVVFEIHGDYKGQPQEFQDEFLKQLTKLGGNVNFHGAYRQEQVDHLMRGVDAVLVPSIWWENSPVVIQEAFRNNRPVLCSDIGGMAEKVRDGIDGFHFTVNSGLELSYLIMNLLENRTILKGLRQTMRRPASVKEVLDEHLGLYARLKALS